MLRSKEYSFFGLKNISLLCVDTWVLFISCLAAALWRDVFKETQQNREWSVELSTYPLHKV